jgi:hypothetical protein
MPQTDWVTLTLPDGSVADYPDETVDAVMERDHARISTPNERNTYYIWLDAVRDPDSF